MTTLPLTVAVFRPAWTLADELNDAQAQDRLARLQRQLLTSSPPQRPPPQRTEVLEQVAALLLQLQGREGGPCR